ncbi:MAG: sigma 54-interacting transcriptional regulator [Myxococcota bacterium]|nr:sigma 54-interacting transcriptional regulator [Myxococcota bacterium]
MDVATARESRSSSSERLGLLLELSHGFIAQRDFDELLPLVVQRTKAVLGAEGCSLLLVDEEAHELYFPVTSSAKAGIDQSLRSLRFPVAQGIAGQVVRTRQPLLVNEVSENRYFNPAVDRQTGEVTRSMLCAPLRTRDSVIGVIEVINSLEGPFEETDLDFLEALALSVALAVETSMLMGSLRDTTTRLAGEVSGLRRERIHADSFPEIIGQSPAMESVFALMESATNASIAVQIQGETGVGKELVARAIHNYGDRKAAPLVALNCGAMPASLLESELFGFARGAFTGADREKPGLFEAADGGTLFLDEINAMPLDQQAKLLRVIQEGEIRRLGETVPRKIDVRLISASNADLLQEVKEKRFREDLYYRLNVFPIPVPPLRERAGDIPLLASGILGRIAEKAGKKIRAIDADVLEALIQYDWPGNVRELENELERALALATPGASISVDSLSPRIVERFRSNSGSDPGVIHRRGSLREARQEFERGFLVSILQLHSGNATRAAKELGISRQMLQKKIKDWDLRSVGVG